MELNLLLVSSKFCCSCFDDSCLYVVSSARSALYLYRYLQHLLFAALVFLDGLPHSWGSWGEEFCQIDFSGALGGAPNCF